MARFIYLLMYLKEQATSVSKKPSGHGIGGGFITGGEGGLGRCDAGIMVPR